MDKSRQGKSRAIKRGVLPRLSADDLKTLRESGLSQKTIDSNGIYTESDPHRIAELLKWDKPAVCLGPCLVFPYRDVKGVSNHFARVRPAKPRTDRKGKSAKYEQPQGEILRVYFPVGCISALGKVAEPIIITEGEKKALALSQAGYTAIGLSGVDCWGKNGQLIDDLRGVSWAGRKVYIAFDHDSKPTTRENVTGAAKRLTEALHRERAKVFFVEIPPAVDGGKQGVDDFLVAHGKREFGRLLEQARPAYGVNAVIVDSIQRENVEWLWKDRIAFGALTLLDGDPGMGKSTLTCDLAARLSKTRKMPGTVPSGKTVRNARVLFLSAEDDASRTIRPRLEAAGADLKRIVLLPHAHDIDGDRPITFPGDLPLIESQIREHAARLVIVDPLMAFMSAKIDTNSDAGSRRVLLHLRGIAERTGAAFVLLRHLNKRAGDAAIYRGGGSIAFAAACRCCLVVGVDREQEGRRLLASVKNNLGPHPKSMTFSIESAKGNWGEASKIKWGGESDLTADDVIDMKATRSSKVDECVEQFKLILNRDGPMESANLETLVKDATGAETRTVRTARKKARVFPRKKPGKKGAWWCKLEGQSFAWEGAFKKKATKRTARK